MYSEIKGKRIVKKTVDHSVYLIVLVPLRLQRENPFEVSQTYL